MYSKALIAFALASFAAAAATADPGAPADPPADPADPPADPTAPPASDCNVGQLQCCNNVQPASSPAASSALGLLGLVLQNPNIPIGLSCNPITAIGVGSGANCAAQPVCCTGNNFNGAVVVGCTPVNLGL